DRDAGRDELHTRDRLLDRLGVAPRHTERLLADLVQLVVLEILRPHEDVAEPHALDHLHCLSLGTGTDGEHGDDGADAKDHAKHGERGSTLVRGQVFDRAAQGLAEGHPILPTLASAVNAVLAPNKMTAGATPVFGPDGPCGFPSSPGTWPAGRVGSRS